MTLSPNDRWLLGKYPMQNIGQQDIRPEAERALPEHMRDALDRARWNQHVSDCAMHNEPAYPAGPCDWGAELAAAERALVEAAVCWHLHWNDFDVGSRGQIHDAAAELLRLRAARAADERA